MTNMLRVTCLLAAVGGITPQLAAQQQPAYESAPVTVTATVEAVDKANRIVTLKNSQGTSFDVKAPTEMEGFNNVKVGDQVSATYFQAVMVQVRKPGDPAPPSDPTTSVVRKDRRPGSETRRQQTFTVTITAIDKQAPSVSVKGPEGRIVTLGVSDPKQLERIRVGDTVDVTYYESLLVKFARTPNND
jgi:hypothetical protein